MTSPNLAITHVAAAQNQKEVTVNDAINALDRALTDALAVDFSGGSVTLTAAQFRQAIAFKPSAGLTAATLTVPQIKRLFIVVNTDGFFTIDVVRGSTTPTVRPGSAFCLYTDGTTNGLYAAGGGGGAFIDLSDTPAAYSGQQGRPLTVNAGATGLVFSDFPGSGALSARGSISGATGTISSASTSSYATKGLGFIAGADMHITAVLGFVNAAAANQGHYAQIARIASASSDAQILDVLGTTNAVTSPSTNLLGHRFPFPTPVTLLANQPYMVAITLTAGTATTPMRVMNISAGAGVAATGPSLFALLKNGNSVGAVQFAAGEAAAFFSVAVAVDFAAGDVLAIAAPDPQDATLADVALTLVFGLL